MKALLICILVVCSYCSPMKKPTTNRLSIKDTSYTVVVLDSMGHRDTTMHAVKVYYVEEKSQRKVLASLVLIMGAIIYIIFKIH